MAAFDEELETEIRQYIDSGRPACSTFKQQLQSTAPNVLYELLKSVRGIGFGSPTCVSAAAFERDLEGLASMLCRLTPEQRYDIVGIENSYGATALHRAVTSNDRSSITHSPRDIVEYLLSDLSTNQQFGLVKVQSRRGYTMLHRAADSCKADIMRYTLSLFSLNLQEKLLSIRNANNISVADASVSALFTTVQEWRLEQGEQMRELADQRRELAEQRNVIQVMSARQAAMEQMLARLAIDKPLVTGDAAMAVQADVVGEKSEREEVQLVKQAATVQLEVEQRAEEIATEKKPSENLTINPISTEQQNTGDTEMDNMESSFTDEYAKLLQMLQAMCIEHSINEVTIMQHPDNCQDVLVKAAEATAKLSGPLNDLLNANREFDRFKVKLIDYDGNRTTELFSRSFRTIELLSSSFRRLCKSDTKTESSQVPVIDLILQAQRVCMVGPAHTLFCKETNEKFCTNKCDIEQIRRDIAASPPIRSIYMKSAHQLEMEMKQTPLIGYRYKYKHKPSTPNHHKLFTNDCALFELDSTKAQDVQRNLGKAKPSRQNELREVNTTDALQGEHFCPSEVAVPSDTGWQYWEVSIERHTWLHIPLVFTSTDKNRSYRTLTNGDCGSIIYFVDQRNGTKIHRPCGMLLGATILPGYEIPIYNAILLSQAFMDIEEDHGHPVLRKLRPHRPSGSTIYHMHP